MTILLISIHDLIKKCDTFISTHPFLSLIAFGILTNLLTDLFKISVVKTISKSKYVANSLSKSIIKYAIEGLELEYSEIKKYHENPTKELLIYVNQLFNILTTVLMFIIFYFIVQRMEIVFTYIYYGLAANRIFRIMAIVFAYNRTMKRVKDFEKYELEVTSQIKYLNSLLTSADGN